MHTTITTTYTMDDTGTIQATTTYDHDNGHHSPMTHTVVHTLEANANAQYTITQTHPDCPQEPTTQTVANLDLFLAGNTVEPCLMLAQGARHLMVEVQELADLAVTDLICEAIKAYHRTHAATDGHTT